MSDIDALRARITAACDAVIASGASIRPLVWGVMWDDHTGGLQDAQFMTHGPCYCPLGALAKAEGVQAKATRGGIDEDFCTDEAVVMAMHLGVEEDWIADFLAGFDGARADLIDYPEALALGRELRAKYLGVSAP